MIEWRGLAGPAAALAVGLYFFRLTRGALHGFFSPDDITNIYRACSYPIGWLVRANLLFFETSPFYRPLPSAWYRVIFHFAGLNPLPYHAINLLLLAANILLTYAVARRLTGSRTVGWLAALLSCYHRQFNGLYFDTGFVFDVLCYFFFCAAFLVYLRGRESLRDLSVWELIACCVLYVCALDSKEMAVTLPLFLGLYEWIYHRPGERRWRGVVVTGALTVVFLIGRLTGEYSLARMAMYRPVFTWDRFMLTSRAFLGDLFFLVDRFTPAAVLLVWAVLGVVAWVSRSKALRFAWLFLMLSAAPVAFVEPRGAAQYYVPLFGWALYFATALAGLTWWLGRWRGPVLLAGVMLLLYPRYKAMGWDNVASVKADGEVMRGIAAQLRELHPALPKGARLLVLNESDSPAWDTMLQVARLSYGDHGIRVDRARKMGRVPSDGEMAAYDAVLEFRGGRLVDRARVPDPRLKPLVRAAEIYHGDWSVVTAQNPGRCGEVLIAKATGLGATSPDVAAGEPFPLEPLAELASRVLVKLNGERAETVNAIGWPQQVDTYRVDFRMPEGVRGTAKLELSVRGVAAPEVELPVR